MTTELSPRQIELCVYIASGKQSKDIGKIMGIETKTVGNHRETVHRKLKKLLGLKQVGIAKITHYAIARGLVKLRFTP